MDISTIIQGSPEWYIERALSLTASHGQEISANGKGLETYVKKKMAEYYSTAERTNYESVDMQRGNELEYQARAIYELEKGVSVKEVGFVRMNEYVLASPDGLVEENGLVEIKCHNDVKHFSLILEGEKLIEKKYIWQMQMQMLVTGRKWCDYCAFNPNFKDTLLVFRIEADEEMHEKLLLGIEAGIELIKTIQMEYEKFSGRSK